MLDSYQIPSGKVTVLIGPNGAGKSRLLRNICIQFLRRGDDVIAVAPTIHDRFRSMPRSQKFRFFGARQGRTAATKVIRSALERASADNPQLLKNLLRALEYTKFDPVVGIAMPNLNLENARGLDYLMSSPDEADQLRSVLRKWENRQESDGIAQLRMDSFSFEELDALSFGILAKHDRILKKTKVTSRIEYFLYRGGKPIPLLEACSGELWFITTVAFISTNINSDSVIAIDEPDTSLHPTWQQNYVKTLLELFYLYNPRIVLSTHSPIIISGANAADTSVVVYEMEDGRTRRFEHINLSLEEMYDRLFGLITPRNHYLSQRAVALLNELNAGELGLTQVLGEFEELRTKSYDDSQKDVISQFEEMARRVDSAKTT